ncbi:NADH dehydrogenase [Gangjinia marincola]|uniref:NADH dehydrogenase n=1 Tax=Gangjinia marincola TaxID=578463 RepID=A0ABN1MJG0_9FLAO
MDVSTSISMQAETKTASYTRVPKVISTFLWLLFLGTVAGLLADINAISSAVGEGIFRFTGFSLLIWMVVTFFSALVSSFAVHYLHGFKHHTRFMVLCVGFTLSVMLLVVSEHVLLLIFSWLIMGIFMSRLIGINSSWGEAREASTFTQRYFFTGSFFLALGVLLLSFYSGAFTLTGLIANLPEIPYPILLIAGLCIIMGAIVQSAMYPFHRWLLSAMTAPTPASALMHAGFVNGAGILLALFASLLFSANVMTVLFIIGGLTAIIAQFTKLLQVNVKQKLACSTIAQMGFMIMQCGLGFFNAAVAHLILHGFYKAYLFLASGEQIVHSNPQQPPKIEIRIVQAVIVGVAGLAGAFLFNLWTGKAVALDSGIFLTLIVAITVGQATYNVVKAGALTILQKTFVAPLLFLVGIGIYALMYNGVTLMMADMPMIANPIPLTAVQVIFGVIFLLGFFIMKLGTYRKIPWLYVKLLNLSQPGANTVLRYKSTNS